MTTKRKRKGRSAVVDEPSKRQKIAHNFHINNDVVKSALLSRFYPHVLSLREYLLLKLPHHSKVRRKKIRSIGKFNSDGIELATFLDQTLVGVTQDVERPLTERQSQWNTFIQRADESASTLSNLTGLGKFSQSEIVDFAVWQLFSRNHHSAGRAPSHILCQGFKREFNTRENEIPSAIPGISSIYPNTHVTSMKAQPWPRILTLWGNEGEKAMIDLILDCGIFTTVLGGQGVYSQLSGQPLSEVKAFSAPKTQLSLKNPPLPQRSNTSLRTPIEITFVRNRMLYARAALNARGGVRFGLRHIHILNRFPGANSSPETCKDAPQIAISNDNAKHMMLYMFPRQFGLHNVFTSNVDSRQTVQPFQDYTLREDEIKDKFVNPPKLPRRLRGKAEQLVIKLQKRHAICAYKELLDVYCPVNNIKPLALPMVPDSISGSKKYKTQLSLTLASRASNCGTMPEADLQSKLPQKPSMMDHASPTSSVATFCVAVLSNLIPNEFWGCGEDQIHNIKILSRNIEQFIYLRRFESMTLHEVSQGLKIANIDWLGPPTKMSQSDLSKRWEIFQEFIYYIFDSILIPLVRANFHVTESNVHRYRLFYFRYDVWKSLAEPALASLKLSMFQEVKLQKALSILDRRKLGFSQIRLLPKEKGIRPIMNLRRRATKKGTTFLGSSINSVLAPIFNVLTYEKATKPERLGASLFSVSDLYTRLKAFGKNIGTSKPLYFAKLDVHSAFDSIPQSAVTELMRSLASEDEYRISKHMETKPGEDFRVNLASKPSRKWTALAHAPDDLDTFDEMLEAGLAHEKRNTVFVENVVSKFHDAKEIFDLLEEHVKNNIVKIGKKFFRQKLGIPQGSVISSHLCNYFYADLEQKHLGFLKPEESLLLRLIDDFLLITTNSSHAQRFLQIMHDGVPQYGVQVNPNKTLVNFEATVNGKKVLRAVGSKTFPYCGSNIDTTTLEIRRDRERKRDMALSDSLTVEYSKNPGHTFHRKVLNAFKIQSHAMFLDTSFNSMSTVLFNIYTAFIETANKTWTYAKCLPVGTQPSSTLLIKTIRDLSELAFVLTKSKGRNKKNVGYKCAVSKVTIEWLVLHAFKTILSRRQSKYTTVLQWLDEKITAMTVRERNMCVRMKGVLNMKEFVDE